MKGFIVIIFNISILTIGYSQKHDDKNDYYVYSKAISEYLNKYDGIDSITTLLIKRKKKDDNIDCDFANESIEDLSMLYAIYRNLVIIKDSTRFADTLFINLACKLDSLNRIKIGRLSNDFDLEYKIKMISECRLKLLFRKRKKDNWKTFYKKFPNSFGIIEVSNIAYTSDKRYAAFYIGYQRYGLAGYGCLLLLDLKNKEKIIKKQVDIWMS